MFMGLTVTVVLVACSLTPDPLKQQDVAATLRQDQMQLFSAQEPVVRPIDLYEAMARALKYNLDYRVQMLEKVVAISEVDLASNEMLPSLAANAGFTSRNKVEASSGYSITNDTASASFSTSQDMKKKTADLSVAWNVLDFGVSYYQARQTTDRLLIAEENRRKLVHTLIQEVQTAYWRAVSAQKLQGRIIPILQQAKQAVEDAQLLEQERLRPQLEMMRYQRAMLDIVRQLEGLQEELDQARTHLVKLLNLPPGLPFVVQEPDEKNLAITPIRVSAEEMEQLALLNRPELRQEMYRARIGAAETRKALLKILPGLEFNASTNYDSNSFAMNSVWETAGIRVTGKLIRMLTVADEIHLGQNQDALNQTRRLALNMAIISQVHIANRQYWDALRRFDDSGKINTIDQKILKNVTLETNNGAQNRLEQIRAATQGILSELQRNKAFADVQNAVGMIFVSLGVDLLPNITAQDGINSMTLALREAVEAWNDGMSLPSLEMADNDTTNTLVPTNTVAMVELEEKPSSTPTDGQDDDTWELLPTSNTVPEIPETKKIRPTATPMAKVSPDAMLPSQEKISVPLPVSTERSEPKKTFDKNEKIPVAAIHPEKKPADANPAVKSDPDQEIRKVIEDWADAWSRHVAQEFFRYYSDAFVPASQWTQQQWKDAYTLLFDTSKSVKTFLADLAVEVESGDRAKAFVVLGFDDNGTQSKKYKTLIVKRETKGWRIVEEASNTAFGSGHARLPTDEKLAIHGGTVLLVSSQAAMDVLAPVMDEDVNMGSIYRGPKLDLPKNWKTISYWTQPSANPPKGFASRSDIYAALKIR